MIRAQAIRFTDQVPAMRAFLERLGLATVISSDGWAVMRSASGDVLLHSAAGSDKGAVSGQTDLAFEADTLDELSERFAVAPVDESYGRSLPITDPLGAALVINETQTDLYGFEGHENVEPDPTLSVCVVRFTDPQGPYADFLPRLGLRVTGEPDDSFVTYAADAGSVGLHVAHPGEYERYLIERGNNPAVHLTFATSADPMALAERLREGGTEVRVDTTFGVMLEFADPDGRLLQVHTAG